MGMTMRVSLPTYNAGTDTNIDHYSVYADSDNVLIKEKERGTMNISDGNNGTITHSLGYIPFYLVYGETSTAGRQRLIVGFDPIGAGWNCYSGTAKFVVQNRSGAGSVVQYYVFYDNLP